MKTNPITRHMKKIATLVCSLFFCASVFGATTNFMVSLATAKHKAAVEGKLYMVHFTANWCTPCKWMDSHTFTDDRVASYLSENYVPVKINVEDFDGIIIKQKNNIQFLPTILIFNSKGEEVGRFEEAIGPSKLMAILEERNIPNNKVKTAMPEPIEAESPAAISRPLLPSIFDDSDTGIDEGKETVVSDHETSTLELNTPTINTELTTPIYPNDNRNNNIPENKPVYTPPINENETNLNTTTEPIESGSEVVTYADKEVSTESNSYTPAVTETPRTENADTADESLAFLTGEGIFELDVKYKSKQGYSVQIGLYAQYENVLAEVNKFKSMYNQNVYVHIAKRNGVTVYRLLLGNFINKVNADQLEAQIKNQGLDCFVSDLSKI